MGRSAIVKIEAAGVCRTDLVARDGHLPTPMLVVLGHEGAGIVERIGSAVTKVERGDHVVMTFDPCGVCPSCVEHVPSCCHDFFPRNFLAMRADGSTAPAKNGQSMFATHALWHERNTVNVPREAPLELLGTLARMPVFLGMLDLMRQGDSLNIVSARESARSEI